MHTLATSLAVTVPHDGLTPQDEWNALPESGRLLRWHLGASYNTAGLLGMPDREVEELVFRARVKLVADMYGRHRVARWDRQKSPPGFWRTEMPTTQELLVDKAEAKALEQDMVKDRLREAMREGGIWIFKDD